MEQFCSRCFGGYIWIYDGFAHGAYSTIILESQTAS